MCAAQFVFFFSLTLTSCNSSTSLNILPVTTVHPVTFCYSIH
jgi:hypothetical protein